MSENVVSFFQLIADASIFDGAFNQAKKAALEFAASYKGSANSVIADSLRMEAAMRAVRASTLAPGAGAEAGAFYGHGGTSTAETSTLASRSGGGLMLGSSLQLAAYGALALAGAAAGVLALTEHLVHSYAAFSSQILLNSEAIGMNTADLQTWEKIAEKVGIDQQSLVLDFERFGKNLVDGAPALKATGVTLKDLGITTTDVGTAILQLSDYFHTHTDQSQKAAIAQALFGRSGSELIPILDQGSAAVAQYKSQLQAMGVILSQSQLFAGAQAQAAITRLTSAFDVAKSELVGAALPAFTAFFRTLTVIMNSNASTWVAIGQTIGNVVMFITGLVAGLAGVSLADILKAPADAGATYQGLGAGAQGAAGGMDAVAAAAKKATDALDDQIAALHEQKRAQDEVFDAQKQAYQDQLDTLHDVTDTRRRQGEDIVTYERRVEELGLRDKIKSVDKAKSAYDRGIDDHIAALEKEKKAVQDASGAMGADLAAGMSTGMVGLNTNLALGMSEAEKKILEKGSDIGADIAAIFDPNSKNAGKANDAAERLGEALGGSLVKGVLWGMVHEADIPIVQNIIPGGQFISWLLHNIPGVPRAAGTITSGPELAWIGEAGTEVVLPTYDRSRSLALMEQSGMAALARSAGGGSGGGQVPSVVINFNGPVADELVASRVISRIDQEMRRRGWQASRGFGTN